MIRHPYMSFEVRRLAAATWLLAGATALLTFVLVAVVPVGHIVEIRQLAAAKTLDAAAAILSAWDASVSRSFAFMLGFDLLYDIAHNNAVAFLAIWGAHRCSTKWAMQFAGVVAWTMWLDTALNMVENLAFFRVLQSATPGPFFPMALAIFNFRFATLLLGLVVGVLLHLLAQRRAPHLG